MIVMAAESLIAMGNVEHLEKDKKEGGGRRVQDLRLD